LALEYVPEILKTEEMCDEELQQNKEAHEFVPEEFITKEINLAFSNQLNSNLVTPSCDSNLDQNSRTTEINPMKIETNGETSIIGDSSHT
jgi:hypothetical protein